MPTVIHAGSRVQLGLRRRLCRRATCSRRDAAREDLQHQRARGPRTKARARSGIRQRQLFQLKHNRPPLTGIYAGKVHGSGRSPARGSRAGACGHDHGERARGAGGALVRFFRESLRGARARRVPAQDPDEEKYPDLETLRPRSRATVKRQELLMDTRNA